MHARRTVSPVRHARRLRADTGPTDRRRLAAAFLSAVLPGLGQLANGRPVLARRLLAPSLVLVALVLLAFQLSSPTRLLASVVSPTAMNVLLVANVVVLGWRLFATLHAFFDRRYPSTTGRAGLIGLIALCLAVALPHGVAHVYGSAARDTFDRIFIGGVLPEGPGDPSVGPGDPERLNLLIIGVDELPWRNATLTDTMMVVSVDPVGQTVSLVSLPRDLVDVPLGNGDNFGPKLNSLMSYADRNPKQFPQGGIRALQDAVGALLGIEIHYYARMDMLGFVKLVDTIGGVDVTVPTSFTDPLYDGLGLDQRGWSVEAGEHRFDGFNALAYVRARRGTADSDFARAARQQEVLVAIRDRLLEGGALFFRVPDLLDLLGDYVVTDLPPDRLPALAAVADEMERDAIVRVVIKPPLVKSGGRNHPHGSVQVPQVEAIREVAAKLFSPPGTPPTPWPTPTPAPTPKPTAVPAAGSPAP